MTSIIAEAVRKLKLQPGDIQREMVDGHMAEIRLLEEDDESASQFADMMMVDLFPKMPRGEGGIVVKARVVTEPDMPPPFNFDESDLAPE